MAAVYHQLVDIYHSSESENEADSDVVPSTSTGPTTSAAAARQRVSSTRRYKNKHNQMMYKLFIQIFCLYSSTRIRSDGDWRSDCRQLLDLVWQRPDSLPFREPVDTIEFPDYLEIIATPMDLRTVKEDLLGGNYDDPLDFAKDVRLIFLNSKNYNTNKRSRVSPLAGSGYCCRSSFIPNQCQMRINRNCHWRLYNERIYCFIATAS